MQENVFLYFFILYFQINIDLFRLNPLFNVDDPSGGGGGTSGSGNSPPVDPDSDGSNSYSNTPSSSSGYASNPTTTLGKSHITLEIRVKDSSSGRNCRVAKLQRLR